MGRHLTASEKARELALWKQTRADLLEVVGPGVPDPGMVPWCEKINAISGVCTVQSCAGHENGERGPGGHLWLRLDEQRARAFYGCAFGLAKQKGIERVCLIYQRYGHEIVEVQFQGDPAGRLDASLGMILHFLESLNGSDRYQVLRIATGAVKSAIDSHGPITASLAPSVAKRVVSALIAEGVIRTEPPDA